MWSYVVKIKKNIYMTIICIMESQAEDMLWLKMMYFSMSE